MPRPLRVSAQVTRPSCLLRGRLALQLEEINSLPRCPSDTVLNMGGAKNAYFDQQERGWWESDERICSSCVLDYALQEAVSKAETTGEGTCIGCGSRRSAPFDVLLENVVEGLNFAYEDALNVVPWDSSEGGLLWPTSDSDDLVDELYGCFTDQSHDAITTELKTQIVAQDWLDRADPDRDPDVLLNRTWQHFCEQIKHRTRYVFWLVPQEPTVDPTTGMEFMTSDILGQLANLIEDLELFGRYKPGDHIMRARTFGSVGEILTGAADLGTPPHTKAIQGNRMSPAGIPLFYGCDTSETALAEVGVRAHNTYAVVGTFTSSLGFSVIDLCDVPRVPSIFDKERRKDIWKYYFLKKFTEEIARPIAKGHDQVEYVPTQVMAEYFLRVHPWKGEVHGIRYPSAARRGDACLALSVPASDCVDVDSSTVHDRMQLQLTKHSVYRADIQWISKDDT